MTTPARPKPWETARVGGTTTLPTTSGTMASSLAPVVPTSSSNAIPSATSSSTSTPPALPQRPTTLSSVVNQTASNYASPYGANRFTSSPYGYGSYNSYSSPYNRFGGGLGGMYGGGMYGGGMYGGMGGMYGPMGGMPGQEMSLTQSFSNSTQATFQMIESIVSAFGGFAQMLESTYMATHSSFFAMVSVAEQFSTLRQTLGSVLGIFTLMRWIRTLIAKITGRPPPADATALTPSNFATFTGASRLPDGTPASTRPSKKPFIMFMLAVFGLPYLMGKLIKALAKGQAEEEERRRLELNANGDASGSLMGPDGQPIDPSKLDFCRVKYSFTPETAGANSMPGMDLAVKEGELVAVLSKSDTMGNPSEWWRCRSRDGRVGYLPAPYLEPIVKRLAIGSAAAGAESRPSSSAGQGRAQTLTSASTPSSRANTMTDDVKLPEVSGKAGDIGIESFQKSQFYS